MKHLLFIAERYPPDIGGLAGSADRIAAALCRLGVEVDVLVWSRFLQPGEVLPPEASAGDASVPQVYRVGLYRQWDMSMPHTLNVLDWLHRTRAYNAVWGHYLFPAGFLAAWFAALNGLPSTVSARGNDIDRLLFPPGDFARLQWTLERASAITAVSDDLARKIRCLTRRDDVMTLQNAVDAQVFAPASSADESEAASALRASLRIAAEEVVLGFAGELREKKGMSFLLNALTTVRQHRPACLLIIGEVRAAQDPAVQLYAVHHPEDAARLIVTGHLTDPASVAAHLRLCDVYLQPSLWEGMPNALLEAMACECGCIASDAGGIPEVIEHGRTGFLIPRSHLHRLGEAVMEWLDLDVEERRRIGSNARKQVLAAHSPAQERAGLQAVLARLLKEAG